MSFRLIYAGLLVLVLASAAWQWSQFEMPAKKKTMLPPALQLEQEFDSAVRFESMQNHNLWDKSRGRLAEDTVTATGEKKIQAVSWALKGVGVQQIHAPTAMIAAGAEVKVYHEGDVLPDGALLLRIMANGIVVELNGEERNVYLFKEK